MLIVDRWDGDNETLIGLNFSDRAADVEVTIQSGTWKRVLDSADPQWGSSRAVSSPEVRAASAVRISLAPQSVVVYALDIDAVTNR